MVINRSPELVEIIPSVGARIALQKYFKEEYTKCGETKTPYQISLPSTSSSSSLMTCTFEAQEMLNMTDPHKNGNMSITCNTPTEVTNFERPLIEESTVNDAQEVIIINTVNEEPMENIQTVETIDTTKVYMTLQNVCYKDYFLHYLFTCLPVMILCLTKDDN